PLSGFRPPLFGELPEFMCKARVRVDASLVAGGVRGVRKRSFPSPCPPSASGDQFVSLHSTGNEPCRRTVRPRQKEAHFLPPMHPRCFKHPQRTFWCRTKLQQTSGSPSAACSIGFMGFSCWHFRSLLGAATRPPEENPVPPRPWPSGPAASFPADGPVPSGPGLSAPVGSEPWPERPGQRDGNP